MEQTPVLIVGGGLAGLTAACFLAKYNIKSILIEKHQHISPHPRAVGFTTRTMEIFEKLDILDQIPQTTVDFKLRRMQVESLGGSWKGEIGQRNHANQSNMLNFSPYLGAAIAQDKLEPILRKRAEDLGCDMRLGHRLLSLQPSSSGSEPVVAKIRDADRKEYEISARFLLAADGHRSTIRDMLRIGMTGRGHLKTIHSVLFRAPALDTHLSSGFHQFQVAQPDLQAFLTTYNDSRWVLMFSDEKERNEHEVEAAILQATGIPDLKYEILARGVWDLRALVADSFSYPQTSLPNIFLLGDAAHTLPPTRGGYGANTGIADAHNLAWKLASVVQGRSKPEILASYDQERRPVAQLRHDQIFAGPDYAVYREEGKDYGSMLEGIAVELGQTYKSDIVLDEQGDNSASVVLTPAELKGRPGSRAPHVWLDKQGKKISSLSLVGDGWKLVTSDDRWRSVAAQASKTTSVPFEVVVVGDAELAEEQHGSFASAFGLSEGAASLIRPDGFVAWMGTLKAEDAEACQRLQMAVDRAACPSH